MLIDVRAGRADLVDRPRAVHEGDEPGDRAVLVVLDLGGDAQLHRADDDAVAGQGDGLVYAFDLRAEHDGLSAENVGETSIGRPGDARSADAL
ncbi:hypothetical protein ACFQ0B_23995 [Nonomuraea thailandensis]